MGSSAALRARALHERARARTEVKHVLIYVVKVKIQMVLSLNSPFIVAVVDNISPFLST